MGLESLTGRAYGPYSLRTCTEKVAEYVAATGDDSARWTDFAPPAFAALALFAAAPGFLSDVASSTTTVIHGDQTFRWFGPFPTEELFEVRGSVDRVRNRGALSIVTFGTTVDYPTGERLLESVSTFLMSSDGGTEGTVEESEPAVDGRGSNDLPVAVPIPAPGDHLPPLRKSASRADLVRYAAASRDWNPIHWDHAAAVAAGLGGVVVHGLLMAAWVTQAAARLVESPHPLHQAQFRFRAPLRPATEAVVTGERTVASGDGVELRMRLAADDVERVTASAILRKA